MRLRLPPVEHPAGISSAQQLQGCHKVQSGFRTRCMQGCHKIQVGSRTRCP